MFSRPLCRRLSAFIGWQPFQRDDGQVDTRDLRGAEGLLLAKTIGGFSVRIRRPTRWAVNPILDVVFDERAGGVTLSGRLRFHPVVRFLLVGWGCSVVLVLALVATRVAQGVNTGADAALACLVLGGLTGMLAFFKWFTWSVDGPELFKAVKDAVASGEWRAA